MFGIISQNPRLHVGLLGEGGFGGGGGGVGYTGPGTGTGGGGGGGSIGTGTGGGGTTTTTSSSTSKIAFDLSEASIANATRKNKKSDILSAYETYMTGKAVGKGGEYAQSAAAKYGVSLEEAARGYLEGAGLWRLAKSALSLDPENTDDDSGVKSTKKDSTTGDGDPFATLDDLVQVFERVFAAPSSSDTQAPVVVVGDATQAPSGGGSKLGVVIVVLAIGAGAVYWFYLRKKGANNG